MSYRLGVQLPLVLLALAIPFNSSQGQSRGRNADRARAIERAEMDRLLLWALPSNKESEAVRLNHFKKIKDDFRDLQSLNNKMMADAWLQDTLDYSSIADMVSKIRGKADDLKDGLNLPEAEKPDKAPQMSTITTIRQFRQQLLVLDQTIMRFVTNPVFQAANTVDVNQAEKASGDLDQVILLANDLKQNAQRLRKTTH